MATEGTPNSPASGVGAAPPPPISATPGTLALVAASAIGSLLGSRIGVRPLAVAAGATALAWLSRKKAAQGSPLAPSVVPAPQAAMAAMSPAALAPPLPVSPAPQPVVAEPLPPTPVFAPAAPALAAILPATNPAEDPRIQAWLARQMDREERAAAQDSIILSNPEELSSPAAGVPWLQPEPEEPAPQAPGPSLESAQEETAPDEADDDYHPEPLVADAPLEHAAWQPHAFAGLTEPRPALPAPPWASAPASKPALPVVEAVRPRPVAEAVPAPEAMPPAVTQTPPTQPPVVPEKPGGPVFSTSLKPQSQPLPAQRPPTAPLAAPFIAASAIPGIEPLPSWNEVIERRPQPQVPPSPTPVLFPAAVTTAPAPDLSAAPASVGVDLESLFDTPVFQGTPLPNEIRVTEKASEMSEFSTTGPLFTAAPHTLSTQPVFQRSEPPGAPAPAPAPAATPEPEAASVPPPSPWHAAANTPIFAEAPSVLTSPSPWAPASTAPPSQPPPPKEDPMAGFFRPVEPAAATAPDETRTDTPSDKAAPVPEIAVHVAAPGEAWFDSPLAAAGVPNPWLPPKGDVEGSDVPLTSSFAPLTPSSTSSPIVDAEVVLRPRAPTQSAVVPKVSSLKPAIIDPEEPAPEDAPQPSAPVKSPREQRAHTSWRSWWKGD